MNFSFLKVLQEVVMPSITVITGVLVVFLNHSVSKVDAKLRENSELRAERESRQRVDFQIYNKMIESLESSNPKQQQVAKALVIVMASDALRQQLLAILEQAGTDTIRKQVADIIENENKFLAEQQEITVHTQKLSGGADWKQYNYDIFWCEKSGPEAQALAKKVVSELRDRGATGRLRVRQLPESINSRQGYQISGYVIRPNANEVGIANMLKRYGDEILQDNEFIVTFSGTPTPMYLSAFICP